jgi:hypothetical protein
VGDIVSESPGDFISVHPGDFVGIRTLVQQITEKQAIAELESILLTAVTQKRV